MCSLAASTDWRFALKRACWSRWRLRSRQLSWVCWVNWGMGALVGALVHWCIRRILRQRYDACDHEQRGLANIRRSSSLPPSFLLSSPCHGLFRCNHPNTLQPVCPSCSYLPSPARLLLFRRAWRVVASAVFPPASRPSHLHVEPQSEIMPRLYASWFQSNLCLASHKSLDWSAKVDLSGQTQEFITTPP